MKRLVQLLVVTLICSASGQAQYVVFTRANNGTNDITIPSGEIWQIHSWYSGHNLNYTHLVGKFGTNYPEINLDGTGGKYCSMDNPRSSELADPIGFVVPGPASFSNSSPLNEYILIFKKINSQSTSNNVSSTSVVIPQSASGDVDVKMEQSADNVTWTECLPGTYNSSTVKRFFRLRAVEK